MSDNKNEKLDLAISVIHEVLEKNKEKDGVKKAYEDIEKLKEKRNIN